MVLLGRMDAPSIASVAANRMKEGQTECFQSLKTTCLMMYSDLKEGRLCHFDGYLHRRVTPMEAYTIKSSSYSLWPLAVKGVNYANIVRDTNLA